MAACSRSRGMQRVQQWQQKMAGAGSVNSGGNNKGVTSRGANSGSNKGTGSVNNGGNSTGATSRGANSDNSGGGRQCSPCNQHATQATAEGSPAEEPAETAAEKPAVSAAEVTTEKSPAEGPGANTAVAKIEEPATRNRRRHHLCITQSGARCAPARPPVST